MQERDFAWEGAFVAFLTFNGTIGTNIVEKALRSLHDGHTTIPGRSARAEGFGHVLNYLLQVVFVTVGGGYLTAAAYRKAQEYWIFSTVIFFVMGSIVLWVKVFSDTPLLRDLCIDIMTGIFPGRYAYASRQDARETAKEE